MCSNIVAAVHREYHREYRLWQYLCRDGTCQYCGYGNGKYPDNQLSIPTLTPNVLVDQQGYAGDGEKQAIVKSREPVESFRLIDKESGEIVYRGKVKQPEYNEDLQLYIGTVDFTEYTSEGSFYLECDRVGQSLSFSIKKRYYEELFKALCERVHESCRERSITEDEVLTLLEACEWYSEVFTDDNGNEIPDMLEYIADWLEKTAMRQRIRSRIP